MQCRIGTALTVAIGALAFANAASAHSPLLRVKAPSLAQAQQALEHHKYVCENGRGKHVHFECKAITWTAKTVRRLTPRPRVVYYGLQYWINRQIYVATLIARAARSDPWPNCPDPFFDGASWFDTVRCENNGNWYDSPGYYRCGLQFDPMWERKYGRLCP